VGAQSHRALFFQHLAQTSPEPRGIEVVEAKGVWLYGPNGEKWIDLVSGFAVSNIGHCHPKVVEAVADQAAKFMHVSVYGEVVQGPQVELSALLASVLPGNLSSIYLTNSGAEAIEGAMKLAKRHTGRPALVSFSQAYHGSTQGALSLMGSEEYKQAFRPLLPGISNLHYGNVDALSQIDKQTAGVFLEILQAEAGYNLPPKGFLEAVAHRCKEVGALLIVDEIQTGFGRTGNLWACEGAGFVPDVICLAKAMGGGMPIGAFASRPEVMNDLSHDPILGHITTFGGHPVSCAAAKAALEVVLEGRLWERSHMIEKVVREELKEVGLIHGKGAMLSVELGSFERVLKVANQCVSLGVLTDWFLFNTHCLRIAPPLIIEEAELRLACGKIRQAANS